MGTPAPEVPGCLVASALVLKMNGWTIIFGVHQVRCWQNQSDLAVKTDLNEGHYAELCRLHARPAQNSSLPQVLGIRQQLKSSRWEE